jgi:hypothetical protein
MTCGSIGGILQPVNPQKWGFLPQTRCGQPYGCAAGVTTAGSAVVSTVVAVPPAPAGESAGAVGSGVVPAVGVGVGAGIGADAGAGAGAGVLDPPELPLGGLASSAACGRGAGVPEVPEGELGGRVVSSEPVGEPEPLLVLPCCDSVRGAPVSPLPLEAFEPLLAPDPSRPVSPPDP